MRKPVGRLLYWSPRILAIGFAAFIALFALDVFDVVDGVWATLLALIVHLIPTWLLLLALGIAWRWEHLGAFLFIGLALLFLLAFGGLSDWALNLLLAGPPALIGLLFLADQHYRSQLGSKY